MHWDPLKSAERAPIMGAMGRDGTMEPWGHEPLRVSGMGPEGAGRAERAGMHWDPLKSADRVQAVKPWEPWGGMGPWSHGAMSH